MGLRGLDLFTTKNFVLFLFSVILILPAASALAMPQQNSMPPQIITQGDLYQISEVPTPVYFKVKGLDGNNEPISVQCDRISGSVFVVGKTTVRCEAADSVGNIARDSFVVTVGYNIVQIPNWVKTITGFWVDDKISDSEYIKNVEFLLEQEIMKVPHTVDPKNFSDLDIPIWIKNNGVKWIDDKITDDEFSIGILWLIDSGLVLV